LPAEALAHGRLSVVESHIKRMVGAFQKFQSGIFVLDRAGEFLVDYPPHRELRGKSFAFREYYRRTIQENRGIVAQPYKSTRTGMPVLTFTAPVRDAHGQLVAIVACSVNLLSQNALGGYRKQKFAETGYLYVFDAARRLVLHPTDDRLLTTVEAGTNRLLEAALTGFEGVGSTINSKGVPMLMAVRQIHSMGWIVAVQVPEREAYAPLVATRQRIVLVSGLAVLAVLVIGAAAIAQVSRPLRQLERAASEIGKNLEKAEQDGTWDLAQAHFALERLKNIRSRDEIGLLASSFLCLATRLNLYITERNTTEEKITALVRTDVLTGLPNRLMLLERLQQAIGLAVQQGVVSSRPRVGVMFIDLDRFKNINDSLGHHVGDRVLTEVAHRLQAAVRASDTVGRMGGDEFVIVLPEMEAASDAEMIARRVITAMAAPVRAEGHELSVTVSIGLATWPDLGKDITSLMNRADAAMYRAKRSGPNNWCWTDPDEASVMPRRLRLENDLR
jgi:diguanylate cyclase (GGDEF)-like protein